MREFKLINVNGTEWDLMRKDAFFHLPEGLGFSQTFESIPTGYSFINVANELDQKSISGEMVFDGYATYQEFVKFVAKEPLTLCYKPLQKWYRIFCNVVSFEKTEIDRMGKLICPISFLCIGTWHELVTVGRTETTEGTGKIYEYTYPYIYADTSISSVEISNGNMESPVKIHIFGAVTNPTWNIVQNGAILADGALNVTVEAGNKIVINADPLEMEIAEYTTNNEYVQDLYGTSDFSTARFIYAPPGNSTLNVYGESGADVLAFVEVEKLAYSV